MINEETDATQVQAAVKPAKRGRISAQRARVTLTKGKSSKKAASKRKAPIREKTAEVARDGSKVSKVLDLLKRPEGASLKEIMKATGWQAHSVRGFLSGTVRKKMGLHLTLTQREDGERKYYAKG